MSNPEYHIRLFNNPLSGIHYQFLKPHMQALLLMKLYTSCPITTRRIHHQFLKPCMQALLLMKLYTSCPITTHTIHFQFLKLHAGTTANQILSIRPHHNPRFSIIKSISWKRILENFP